MQTITAKSMHWSREACERERWYVAKAARVAPTNSSSFSLMSCLGSLSTRLLIDRYHAPAYYTLRVKGNKKTFSGPGASLVDFFVFQFRLPQNIYIWLGRDPFGAWDSHEICFFFFFLILSRIRGPYIGLSAARGNETLRPHHTRVDVAVPFELDCISSYVWLLDQCTYTA